MNLFGKRSAPLAALFAAAASCASPTGDGAAADGAAADVANARLAVSELVSGRSFGTLDAATGRISFDGVTRRVTVAHGADVLGTLTPGDATLALPPALAVEGTVLVLRAEGAPAGEIQKVAVGTPAATEDTSLPDGYVAPPPAGVTAPDGLLTPSAPPWDGCPDGYRPMCAKSECTCTATFLFWCTEQTCECKSVMCCPPPFEACL